jgi:class 3 adenylate cyclase
VNVASRLRDLNVALGTSVLVSEDVTRGLERAISARLVTTDPVMKGVSHPPAVLELPAVRSWSAER